MLLSTGILLLGTGVEYQEMEELAIAIEDEPGNDELVTYVVPGIDEEAGISELLVTTGVLLLCIGVDDPYDKLGVGKDETHGGVDEPGTDVDTLISIVLLLGLIGKDDP